MYLEISCRVPSLHVYLPALCAPCDHRHPFDSCSLFHTAYYLFYLYDFSFDPRVLLAGAAVGVSSAVVSTPFELVKTQMQLNPTQAALRHTAAASASASVSAAGTSAASAAAAGTASAASGPVIYRNSMHAARHIASNHGVGALWRGHVVNTVRESTFLAVYFFVRLVSVAARVLLLKLSIHCLMRTESIALLRSFFNDSTTGHCVLAGPASVFFSAAQVYEHGKSAFASLLCDRLKVCDSPAAAIPLSGGLSGACAWFVSFPLDCVKSGLQGRPFSVAVSRAAEQAARGAAADSAGTTSAAQNSASTARRMPVAGQQTNAMSVGGGSGSDSGGAFRVARHLFATRGIGGFYAGIVPSIARAFIVSGTRFSAYEATMWALKK